MSFTAADVKRLREKTGAGMLDCQKALKEANGNFDEADTILKKMGLAAVAKRAERATEQGRIFTSGDTQSAAIMEIGCETDFVARNEQFVATGKTMVEKAAKQKLGLADAGLKATVEEMAATIKENITLRRLEVFPIAADEAVDCYVHGDAGSVGVLVKFKFSSEGMKNNDAVKTFMHDCALHAAAFKPQFLDPSQVAADYIAKQTEIFMAQVAEEKKPEEVKKKIVEGKVKKHLAEICFVEQGFVKDDKKSVIQMAAEIGKQAGGTITLADYRVYKAGEAI